jgi:hypothetical protein
MRGIIIMDEIKYERKPLFKISNFRGCRKSNLCCRNLTEQTCINLSERYSGFAANPPESRLLPLIILSLAIALLTVLSLFFLWRNHNRHRDLNQEFISVLKALQLMEKDQYMTDPVRTGTRRHLNTGENCIRFSFYSVLYSQFLS